MFCKSRVVTLAIVLLSNCHVTYAAEYRSNTLLFPELTYKHLWHQQPKSTKQNDLAPAITLLHAGRFQSLNILVEINANENTQRVERLQLGFDYAGSHKLWLGRGHTPAGYWNTEYHHGSYLQTSLSRPGPTLTIWPRHLTGLSLEGAFSRFNETIQYSLLAGLGPTLKNGGLDDVSIIEFDRGHRFGITGRLSYTPDPLGNTEMGIFLGYYDVNSLDADHGDFGETIAGAFINWEKGKNRFISELFYINSDLSSATIMGDDYFISWYAQYERKLTQAFTLYGRIEESLNENDSSALKVFRSFTTEGKFIGIRYDFLGNQAFTVEASSIQKMTGQFDGLNLKWNAVFP